MRFGRLADDREDVGAMLQELARRGPHDSGIVRCGPATLGHRRLAILDPSAAGHQPMWDPERRLLLSFNGEIYNYRELATELGIDRPVLKSTCDTEVVLHAWRRWGPETLDHLVGRWAFALFDSTLGRLWLARDRFGEKPLFWHSTSDRIAFASSISAVLRAPGVPRELDDRAVVEFLTLRYVIAPRTIVRDVRKVPPGHYVEVSPTGEIREHEWYVPRFRPASAVRRRKKDDSDETFAALFARACRRCIVSDVNVGLLLSDGIDSNAIRAALLEQGFAPPAFTFGATGFASDLDGDAKAMSGGLIVQVLASTRERWDVLDEALSNLTEPVGDGASLTTWLLLREARKSATVFLCGHGGDEVLGGYRLSQARFRLATLRWLSWMRVGAFDRACNRHLNGHEILDLRKQRLRRLAPRQAPEAALYLIDRPLEASEVDRLFDGRWPEGESYLSTIRAMYSACWETATDLDRIQEVLMRTFLSANILPFADSVAMAQSVELRMPFLDRDLVDFVLGLEASQRVGRLPGRINTKLPLRRWASSRLPKAILMRRKRGFASGSIAELSAHDAVGLRARILRSRAVRRVLPGVEHWLQWPMDGSRGPRSGTLWALLVLAVWCESVGAQ